MFDTFRNWLSAVMQTVAACWNKVYDFAFQVFRVRYSLRVISFAVLLLIGMIALALVHFRAGKKLKYGRLPKRKRRDRK